MPSAHAKLSPSASYQWLTCPGSLHAPRLETIEDTSASDAGTAGHAVFQQCVEAFRDGLSGVTPEGFIGQSFVVSREDEPRREVVFTDEMAGWVREAFDWVVAYVIEARRQGPVTILCEVEVDPGRAFGLPVDPETGKTICWGTADLVILTPTEIVIFDLKLGFIEVEVEDNTQLFLYGLGVEWLHAHMSFETLRTVIHQPRAGGAKVDVVPVPKLHTWRDETRAKIQLAQDPAAPRKASKKACHYCKAAAGCEELRAHQEALAKAAFASVDTLTPAELGQLLERAPMVENFIKALRAHATRLLELGTPVPGWKRVMGKEGDREWVDETQTTVELPKLGVPEDKLYKPRELISPAQVEKIIGKKKATREALAALVKRAPGRPKLVPESHEGDALPPEFPIEEGEVKPALPPPVAQKALPPKQDEKAAAEIKDLL